MKSPITTHILDTSAGRPATGVPVSLWRRHDDSFASMGQGETDSDGRIASGLIDSSEFRPGQYQLRFETAAYFSAAGVDSFYPRVIIDFLVSAEDEHYHVPLLIAPFGYSTYRGS